jgi:hypothetical protein
MMKKTVLLATLGLLSQAHAYEAKITKGQLEPSLDKLLEKARLETGADFQKADFQKIEERNLATSKFTMYVQTNSMVPVSQTAIRIWSDLETNELILAEMHLNEDAQKQKNELKNKYLRGKFSPGAMKSKSLANAVSTLVSNEVAKHPTDSKVLGMKFKDQWDNGDLVREVEVRGRRGVHHITISLLKNKVTNSSYTEFPQSEYLTVKANVFPIYEEAEGTGERLPYEQRELNFIHSHIHDGGEDPMSGLGNLKFPESRYYPILAGTPVGEIYGLWSESYLRSKVEGVVNSLPKKKNDFESGMLLSGKYATINLHPDVKESFKDIAFALRPTTNHMIKWTNASGEWEAKPVSGFAGKVINSAEELENRIPFRHPENDPTYYINSGVDEVQVYYAVTVLMESLVAMGFTDQELSEKPFHAFLYDPDIGMRDNAYYYDNTINFTTYNPGSPNMARDNPTIWHELGHAIMDRIMGEHLGFAGTKGGYGGLSEGMADFVASIVVEDVTGGQTFPGKDHFRIINQTGFDLTNEYHDEGEAYGGAMNDMLLTVIETEGKAGLYAFADLTLEAMRLTRNHPALTAAGWFEHMLYADELGSAVRAPGKYKNVITDSLVARNFSFSKEFKPASMLVMNGDQEVTSASPGSRDNPISGCGKDGKLSYDLSLKLTAGDANFITFPATVKVEYQKGALQGAVKWDGEVNNPEVYVVNSEEEVLTLPIRAGLECDYVNQPDGSCKDYAYLQIYKNGVSKPVAKKRFYLKINKDSCQ